jgi:hypothetical protein
VKPETAAFLAKSHECLAKADGMLAPWPDARLVKDEPVITVEMRAFLGRTYNLKAIADYETGQTGPDSKVTTARATEAIVDARRFVAAVAALIPEGTAP